MRSAEPAPTAEPDPEPARYEPDPEPVDLDAADLEEPPAAEPSPPGKETNMDAQLHVVGQNDPGPDAEDNLLSRATDQSVSHAFNLLTHTVLSHNARTLEDLVTEMLRPMLRDWLDLNLPPLVERLVRAEIERVARGSR